jgi:hypothetical protein
MVYIQTRKIIILYYFILCWFSNIFSPGEIRSFALRWTRLRPQRVRKHRNTIRVYDLFRRLDDGCSLSASRDDGTVSGRTNNTGIETTSGPKIDRAKDTCHKRTRSTGKLQITHQNDQSRGLVVSMALTAANRDARRGYRPPPPRDFSCNLQQFTNFIQYIN